MDGTNERMTLEVSNPKLRMWGEFKIEENKATKTTFFTQLLWGVE